MGRKILAIVAAWITGGAIFLLAEMVGTLFAFETPKNMSYMSPEEIAAYMSTVPTGGYLTVLFGYLLGTFAAGWMVTKVSKDRHSIILPLIVGVLFLVWGLAQFFVLLPGQPAWFIALSLLSFIPMALLGHRAAK